MSRLNNLCSRMIEFYRDDPARIQHFIKVHSFAKLIGEEEHLDEKLLYILKQQLMYMILESVRRRLNLADVTVNSRSRKVRQRQRKC